MARARNIKPGFFRNADLVELPFETRLLFIGLWTIADRAGRLEDRPKQIKMDIFPADNVDCDACIKSLADKGMLTRYEVDGKRYLQITNFVKHQNPHRDEKASTIPDEHGNHASTNRSSSEQGANTVQAQCTQDASTTQAPCEHSANTVAIGLIPDSLIPEESQSQKIGAHKKSDGGVLPSPNGSGPPKADSPGARASRLPADWLLPKAWGEWALGEQPGWSPDDVRKEADKFRDHWLAKGGADARKVDWLATWRTWVRRSSDFSAKSGQSAYPAAKVTSLFAGAV